MRSATGAGTPELSAPEVDAGAVSVGRRARHRAVLSEAFWVSLGQAAAAIGSIAGVRILTRALEPSAYGELALGMTVATLGLQVLLSPLTTATLRFFAAAQENRDLPSFLSAVRQLLRKAVSVIVAIGALIFLVAVASAGWRWTALVLASVAFTVLSGTSSVLDGMQNAARQRLVVAWHDGIAPWTRFGLALLLIAMLHRPTSSVAMSGYALAAAAVLGSQYLFFRMKIRSSAAGQRADGPATERWAADIGVYARPLVVWGVFTWAQLASDRWALGALVSTHDAGLYSAVYQLGFYPILMLSQVLTQLAGPVLFERAGDGSSGERVRASVEFNSRIVVLVLGLTAVGTLAAWAIHPLVGRLLLGKAYAPASHFLPWVVLAGGLYATAQACAFFFLIRNESGRLLAPKIVTSILAVALNLCGAWLFGISGIIGATLLFGAAYLSWLLILMARSRGESLKAEAAAW